VLSYALAFAFSAWCIWYLYAHFDWAGVLDIIRNARLAWMVTAAGASIVGYFALRALRWRAIVPENARGIPTPRLYMISAITIGLSIVTPGQIGEALKIELFSRNGGPGRLVGSGAFLAERLIDAAIIGTVAIVGLAVYLPSAVPKAAMWAASAIVLGVAIFGWLVVSRRWHGTMRELASPIVALSRHRRTLFNVVLLSVSSWAMVALGWLFSLRAIDIRLDFLQALWLVAVIAVVQIASMVPGGIGVSDLLTVKLLTVFGCHPEAALAGAVALRIYALLVIALAAVHLVCYRVVGNGTSHIMDTR
jgi:uncharacterized membrane protein YbhN (UPF0104 family)